jgi:hypothetical protein
VTQTQLDYEGLIQAIVTDPDDQVVRLAIMDYYRELGDNLRVDAWRNLEGKKPMYASGGAFTDKFFWWFPHEVENSEEHSRVSWTCWMPMGMQHYYTYRVYASAKEAFEAAVEGYMTKAQGKPMVENQW